MNITSYSPEEILIEVNGTQVTGYVDKSFLSGTEELFTVKLHFASNSVGFLKNLKPHPVDAKVRSGLVQGEFINGEYVEAIIPMTSLDFSGRYEIQGPLFDYSVDNIKVEFSFIKI